MRRLLSRAARRVAPPPSARALSSTLAPRPPPASAPVAPAPAPSSSSSAASSTPTLEQLSPLLDRMDGRTVVGGFDSYGFNVNGVRMRGSVLVFGTFALLWDAASPVDVCPRLLAPLHMVRPKPELVLIGTGRRTHHVNPAVYAYMARHGIAVESMSTVRLRLGAGRRGAPRGSRIPFSHARPPASPTAAPRRPTPSPPSTCCSPRAARWPRRWWRWSP